MAAKTLGLIGPPVPDWPKLKSNWRVRDDASHVLSRGIARKYNFDLDEMIEQNKVEEAAKAEDEIKDAIEVVAEIALAQHQRRVADNYWLDRSDAALDTQKRHNVPEPKVKRQVEAAVKEAEETEALRGPEW